MFMARSQPFSNVRWDVGRLQDEMDRLFNRWSGGAPRLLSRNVYPPVNLWEDNDNLYVEAELPGFELSELEIFVTGENQLSIKGERKPPQVEGGAWHRQERGYGAFSRIIELPIMVDSNNVSAEFRNGVLTIMLPKHETAKPRRIQVKSD